MTVTVARRTEVTELLWSLLTMSLRGSGLSRKSPAAATTARFFLPADIALQHGDEQKSCEG